MAKYIICAICIVAWVYLLTVLKRAKLQWWTFLVGAFGEFIFLMILVRPLVTEAFARAVAAIAAIVGNVTGTFDAFLKYGTIFIDSAYGAITLQIDFECSGVIEIMAFISLLTFFVVYTKAERVIVSLLGVLIIMLSNALRIIIICEMIYFRGPSVYYVAHTLVGRIVFYVLTVLLYFFVFTKPHIVRMKIGKFSYGNNKQST